MEENINETQEQCTTHSIMGCVCPECKSEMENKLQESWYGDTIVHFECNCGKKIIMIDCHPRCDYSVKREMKFDRDSICHEKILRHGWL
jgi:hypothetical protein